jgi:oxaloacetate decarboxylase alpha subunit
MNVELQARVLEGAEPISCRPADLIDPELHALESELLALAAQKDISLVAGAGQIDDVLTYALFPQVGLRFIEHRGDPSAFEPAPGSETPAAEKPAPATAPAVPVVQSASAVYTVTVGAARYQVEVSEGGEVTSAAPVAARAAVPAPVPAAAPAAGVPVSAPLAGNIVSLAVASGDRVEAGDVVVMLEAMKMETEVRAPSAGTVLAIAVTAGDAVAVGDSLLTLSAD